MDGWATLETIGGKSVLRFQRRLAHPPEKVFRAISDPAELEHWFPAAVEAELRPGAPMRFTFEDLDFDAPTGEIVEVDPPKLLVYTWGDDVLRWEVVPEPGGCRLHFTHTLAGDGLSGGRLGTARNAAGWDTSLDALAARLDREEPSAEPWLPRNEAYVERFGLAEGVAEAAGDGFLVRFERDAIQPADAVWALLTGGAEPVPGDRPPQRFANAHVPAGAVTAVEPGRALEYEWRRDGVVEGRVRWELVERSAGIVVRLTQSLPGAAADLRATALAAWQIHLELLHAALNGDERCPPHGRFEALRERYAERLGAPVPPAIPR